MRRTFVTCILSFLILFPYSVFAIDADNVSREGPKTYHVYDDIQLISSIKFSYGKSKIIIKAVFPELISISVNESIDHFNELIKDMIAEGISSFKSRVGEMQSIQQTLPSNRIRNNLYIDYAATVVAAPKHHIISVRMSFQGEIAGKAHPYHYHRVINFDLDNDQAINLADLFSSDSEYLEILSEYSQTVLNERLKYKTMIATGTRPTESNFANWNLKSDGLFITFDEYQVAPYVNGTQTLLVPFSAFKKIIEPTSVIGACNSKKKKRCLQRNLLTGGFIDEALNTTNRRLYPIFSQR